MNEETIKRSEVFRCFEEIDNAIMKYRADHAELLSYFILPLEHRQALRVNYAEAKKINLYEVPDVVKYFGIPIIKKEESIIIGMEEI